MAGSSVISDFAVCVELVAEDATRCALWAELPPVFPYVTPEAFGLAILVVLIWIGISAQHVVEDSVRDN